MNRFLQQMNIQQQRFASRTPLSSTFVNRSRNKLSLSTKPCSHRRTISHLPVRPSETEVILLFPGQGSQYVGMSKCLYDNSEIFRHTIQEAAEAIQVNLPKLIYEGPQETLNLTANAQPAILSVGIGLLRVIQTKYKLAATKHCQGNVDVMKNVKFVLGHSLGEYAALVATDSISFPDAVKLVRRRGEAMQESVSNLPTSMSALMLRQSKKTKSLKQATESLNKVEDVLRSIRKDLPDGEVVELANLNSSFQTVISGTSMAVDTACGVLQAKRIAARAVDLPVSAPFHCSLMRPAAEIMKDALKNIEFRLPKVPVLTNVNASLVTDAKSIPDILYQQITKPVMWHQSILHVQEKTKHPVYVAMGPSKVIGHLLQRDYPAVKIFYIEEEEDIRTLSKWWYQK